MVSTNDARWIYRQFWELKELPLKRCQWCHGTAALNGMGESEREKRLGITCFIGSEIHHLPDGVHQKIIWTCFFPFMTRSVWP